MSRKIMRVPLDFSWPLNKRWTGYVNPWHRRCPLQEQRTCHNGLTAAGAWLYAIADQLSYLGREAAKVGTTQPRSFSAENSSWAPFSSHIPEAVQEKMDAAETPEERRSIYVEYSSKTMPHVVPLPSEMTQFVAGLAKRAENDALFPYYLIGDTLRAAAGLDATWGQCPTCKGSGTDPAYRERFQSWEKTEPPSGEGWQLWETVSEGSPISPVFPTVEKFRAWLHKRGHSATAVDNFIARGSSVGSVITADGQVFHGIDTCSLSVSEDSNA